MVSFTRFNDTVVTVMICVATFIAFLVIFYNIGAIKRYKRRIITKILAILLSVVLILFNVGMMISYYTIPSHNGYHYQYTHTSEDTTDWQTWQEIEEQHFQQSNEKDKWFVTKNIILKRR